MSVKELEKKIVALKLDERKLIEERNRARVGMLMSAENHPLINKIISDFFGKSNGVRLPEIERFAQQARCSGRYNEEHLSEVSVTLTLKDIEKQDYFRGCTEFSIRLRIADGFDDPKARRAEKRITDEIHAIRTQLYTLNEEKKQLKEEARANPTK